MLFIGGANKAFSFRNRQGSPRSAQNKLKVSPVACVNTSSSGFVSPLAAGERKDGLGDAIPSFYRAPSQPPRALSRRVTLPSVPGRNSHLLAS
jgi:hypothetical protein